MTMLVAKLSRPWAVVAVSFMNIAVAYGLNFSFSVFFVAILEEFKWSRASVVGAFSLSSVILAIASWPGGRLTDRVGPRRILIAGSILLSTGLMASAAIREIWHLYFLFGIVGGLALWSLGWVTNSVLISHWFEKNRGAAVGVAFAGMGIGILLVGPSAQLLISALGWRMAYVGLGLIVLCVLLPLNFLIRDKPKSEGDAPFLTRLPDVPPPKTPPSVETDWTLGRSMRTVPFWALFFAYFLIPMGNNSVAVHQVAYLADLGYSKIFAASLFGLMGLMSSVGRPLFGALSDRIGRQRGVNVSFASTIGGILIFLLLPSLPSVLWVYAATVFYGLGFGARGPILTAMLADRFPGKNFGSIYGFVSIANGAGGALGPWMAGVLYDWTGSYKLALSLSIPILFSGCMLFWVAGQAGKRGPERLN